MINYGHYFRRFWLLAMCTLLFGATADFPKFEMEEYEEALIEEKFFFETPDLIPVPRVAERLYGEGEQQRFPVVRIEGGLIVLGERDRVNLP